MTTNNTFRFLPVASVDEFADFEACQALDHGLPDAPESDDADCASTDILPKDLLEANLPFASEMLRKQILKRIIILPKFGD